MSSQTLSPTKDPVIRQLAIECREEIHSILIQYISFLPEKKSEFPMSLELDDFICIL